ncbi:transketolase [Natronospira bacteriovora]|uniref:Transketolase n=1 Tax=Natronospira bacteriovora TaxID=3069753 RepID=A0ABU0W6C4_9GAMM|nr:transketolase [Natronospira sp. AB-CW4]MDQ2069559.1 transketolase [Natronospira sp. AB-CW4]
MPSRRELANAIRALSMDAVQKANSGHPGAPMGMADIAEVLWNDFFRHNPLNPKWDDRDRFVMSNGHGSMLVYSVLHLTGYDLSMDEIRNFRQLHSMTPGHPEYGYAPGVETTTGPLGQGLANAVGMALGEKILSARFNQPGYDIVDHFTYVFMGDGCLMEGISHEACSLAGTLGLGKLIAFYDDNGISIDGEVDGWFTDDTPRRFEAYGWHVVRDVDGHDAEAVKAAIEQARAETGKPSIICCKTVIGFGSPNKKGTAGVHGAALGDEEVAAARKELDWPHAPFEVPDEIRHGWDARSAGQEVEDAWRRLFENYRREHPELAAEYQRRMSAELPGDWEAVMGELLTQVNEAGEKLATRKASGNVLDALGHAMPELIGGSADLSGSNNTQFKGAKTVTAADPDGNYIYYGVREFAMSAMVSGLALHGGFVPYAGTFLTFSDYARNAVRMAALMKVGSIFVYTHDSIGLGEDGPTHQSVEHLASLRLIPNMTVWRPCDTLETAVAWQDAVERRSAPTCLALSRQGLPFQPRDAETIARIRRGAYVLSDSEGKPDLILIGTGSEVALCTEAADRLREEGLKVRVVSMPSSCVFQRQEPEYRRSVLPADVPARVAVEAGVTACWRRWVGDAGEVVGLDTFGESAPADDVFKHFGFTVTNVIETARGVLKNLGN